MFIHSHGKAPTFVIVSGLLKPVPQIADVLLGVSRVAFTKFIEEYKFTSTDFGVT